MKRFEAILAMLTLAFLISGCLSSNPGHREVIGSAAGAAGLAAVAANNIEKSHGRGWAVAAGALLGSILGADIGRSLDRANIGYDQRRQRIRGHSQQVPVSGFAPPPKVRGASPALPTPYSIRDAQQCSPLEGGLRPIFACRNNAGQWFVLQ